MKKRTKEQISYNMSRIKSKNTLIERILGSALRKVSIKFKHNDKNVFGKPDFVISGYRIAIFCDSAFWHGYRNMSTKLHNFRSRRKFWLGKISSNIKRDKHVNNMLKKKGWRVIRFWDFQIREDVEKCRKKILQEIEKI